MFNGYENKLIQGYEDKAPKKWAIIASGPSLTPEDVNAVRGMNVIVINTSHWLAPWADILYACDPHWWDWHYQNPEWKAKLDAFQGEKWTQDKDAAKKYGLNFIESKAGGGISTDPKIIYQGSNSGVQAINLAYHCGARDIILLGYDMQGSKDKPHWHGHHPSKIVSGWHAWLKFYDLVAADAAKLGVRITNCTRQTALTCFERMNLEQALSLAPARHSQKALSQ